jgi:hypothetical protein
MELLTQSVLSVLPQLYEQDNNPDPKAVVKFFNPCGGGTWWITEGSWTDERGMQIPVEEPDEQILFGVGAPERAVDFTMFGFVTLGDPDCAELGYVSLRELASITIKPFGLGIERDRHWSAKSVKAIQEGVRQ